MPAWGWFLMGLATGLGMAAIFLLVVVEPRVRDR